MTVVDQNGDVLNAPGSDAGNVAAGTLEQQQTEAYEQSLDDSLQDMLATVLGPGTPSSTQTPSSTLTRPA